MRSFLAIITLLLVWAQAIFAIPGVIEDSALVARSGKKPPKKVTLQGWLEDRLLDVFSTSDTDAQFTKLFERTWSLDVSLNRNNDPVDRATLKSNLLRQKRSYKSIKLIYEDIREIDTSGGQETSGIVAGTFRIRRRGLNSSIPDAETKVVFITTIAAIGANKTENLRIVKNVEFIINTLL